jgi:hypothetical protein
MKTIWIGIIPSIFGYGIAVAEDSEDKCTKALETAYSKWVEADQHAHNHYEQTFHEDGTKKTRFEMALEYWGGYVREIKLGEGYNDDFR